MNTNQRQALERLITIAKRDTGQCRRVANFLLAWWNVDVFGGWEITDVWSLDRAITADIFIVFGFIAQQIIYPDKLGYEADFKKIIKQWRPEIFKASSEADA